MVRSLPTPIAHQSPQSLDRFAHTFRLAHAVPKVERHVRSASALLVLGLERQEQRLALRKGEPAASEHGGCQLGIPRALLSSHLSARASAHPGGELLGCALGVLGEPDGGWLAADAQAASDLGAHGCPLSKGQNFPMRAANPTPAISITSSCSL